MSNLTLDGSTSFIGTEFIKLLATGSSNLATEEYVDDAIEQNGGGGGGNVDLSNYYTQTEVDNLLNNKLNVNNPQDIIGNLRLDPTNGLSKIILNAVSPPNANDDFYCNGSGQFNGTLRVSLLTSDGDVNCDGVNADVFNSNVITNDIVFKHNDIEYMRFNVDDNAIDLSTDLDLQTSELMCNNFNCSDLNDVVFKIMADEYLRFQVSDNTVRVPNTKAFLSQNIFTDIIKPVAFANDVVLNGGNSTNDAYEEYIRLDASAERMIVSKATKFENNIQFNVGQNISWTNVFIREVFSSRPEFDLIVNGSTSHMRMWVAGAIRQAITNTTIACKVNIDAEQGITVFNGQQLITNTVNSHTNSNLVIQRSGSTAITLKAGNEVDFSGYVNINNISTENDTDMAIRRSDIEFIRLFKDGATSAEAIFCYKQLRATQGFKATTIDTENVNDNLDFQRNGSSYMVFNSDRININQPLHLAGTLFIDTVNKLSLKPSLESGVNIFDIRNLHPVADNPMIRYRVGEGGGETIVCEMTNDRVSFQRNVLIGTAYELQTNTIDTVNDNDLVISRNNIPFLTLDKFTEDTVEKEAIICSKQLRANGNMLVNNLQINQFASGVEYADFRLHNADSVVSFFVGNSTNPNFQITNANINLNRDTIIGSVKTNTIDTNGDNDLTIRRNGTNVLNIFSYTPTNGQSIIVDAQSDCGISSSWLFANTFANRTGNTDTEFRGAIAGGLSSGKVYMKYLHASETLDFDCVIDNTGRSVIGNILDTTVSDERLKTDIEDVDTDFTSCIKNVKVKTFKYKDDKYKTNDTYGFIAQELKEHLPKECKNIVKENKVKNEDETFLSINYMKLSVVLWKCCQEQQSKIEHLEASIYEMMEDIKELKGKKTTKPKAKAKSKTKVEK